MKKLVDTVSALPSKRVYQSIIADYDLSKSICELVDNGLDVWERSGRKGNLTIKIVLNEDQKTISVEDDAGGVPETELNVIVGPGQTGSATGDEIIGFFGVGTKRAMVALGQDAKVTTRFGSGTTFRVEFDDPWIDDETTWDLPYYEVDPLPKGTTRVELQKLRVAINDDAIKALRLHLGATYAKFLGRVLINRRRSPLCSDTDLFCTTVANIAKGHKRSSFNNDRAALIPSIARRRVGQVRPEDDLVLVVEAEGLAGGLELCAARVLNATLKPADQY